MDGNAEVCLGLGLGLGLGLSEFSQKREIPQKKNKRPPFLDLSIRNHDRELNSGLKIIRQDDRESSFREDDQDINFSMNFGRKKLRLTRDQTTLLEDSFRQHTTLNTAQKLALAEKLNLKPRQVEVWFQNRRARTKLKQTEVECEILKKNCERLGDENRRLKKELLELRSSMKIEKPAGAGAAFFHHKGAAVCVKNGTGRGGGEKQEAAAAAVMAVVHEP